MTEATNQHTEEDPLQEMKDLTAQWAKYFNGIQQMLDENERLRQRVAALESENTALTDTINQWKNNDEWSNRVTYDNVVDQIASLEDASKRDDEGDAYSDKQVAQVLEACAGKGQVIDAKWKWAGAYWLLRWACNYPVDAKDFCKKIGSLEMDIAAEYECSYESIRKICTLSFMDYDPRRMDSVRVSKNDQGMFSQCREIVLKLVDEFGKTSLPQE